MLIDEKIFKGEVDVRYLFKRSSSENRKLVIVFSAFPPINTKPKFNYINTLEGLDTNKLYILDDFGCRASYYLCEDKDYKIENTVIKLINKIVQENNINHIISSGSSKGGYAALYYGIKYGFNSIIAASPQFLLGNYLLKETNTTNVAKFISGNIQSADMKFLNEILFNTINSSEYRPSIYIHVGEGEDHYQLHVKPLLECLNSNSIPYYLDLGNYSNHSDVSKFFPTYFRKIVCSNLGLPYINEVLYKQEECQLYKKVRFKIGASDNAISYAWYVYKDKDIVYKRSYSKENFFDYQFIQKGTYKFKVFAINSERIKTTLVSKKIEV
ncbi:Two component regulator three Y domain-containing protein [Fictibacillus nanhaiensis]|uniref:Two component regulator three Y domain-containing protein n=1 Tax=Fictibacillus nanhaiensis TaxID=742169 RepID=A0ABS2ZNM3_9BACL|nr:Two component regulator three Y domain-containing protein [Fictibacillus nanhaiensis]